jgi:hypothetical protein
MEFCMTTLALSPPAGGKVYAVGRPRLGPIDPHSVAGQFGRHLDSLLESRKLTPAQFAERCCQAGLEISTDAVHYYLRGKSTPIMPDLLPMARALGLAHWQAMVPPAPAPVRRKRSKS